MLSDYHFLAVPRRPKYSLLVFNDPSMLSFSFCQGLTHTSRRESKERINVVRPVWKRSRDSGQTIHSACGSHGLLHAVCNGEAGRQIRKCRPCLFLGSIASDEFKAPGSRLANVLMSISKHQPASKGKSSATRISRSSMNRRPWMGVFEVPPLGEPRLTVTIPTCFVITDGQLYELAKDLTGLVDLGELGEEDGLVSDAALAPIRDFIESKKLG